MNLISVIIPHYNNYLKLNRLINSIPKRQEIEIIIIDDKSTSLSDAQYDNLLNNKRVTFISLGENKGAGYARNIGVNQSNGKYLIFADADDYFIKENFFKLLDHKDLFAHNDITFVTPKAIKEPQNKKSRRANNYIKLVKNYNKTKTPRNEIKLRVKFHAPWSKIFRRDFLINNEIKFQETKVSNDIMFSIESGLKAKIIGVNMEPFYVVTESKNSLTKIKTRENLIIRTNVNYKFMLFIQNSLTSKELKYFKFLGLKNIIKVFLAHRKVGPVIKTFKKQFSDKIYLFKIRKRANNEENN